MPYVLGIDVGGSRTMAAICHRGGAGWGEVETVRLGSRSAAIPSMLYLAPDGVIVAGESAQRHARAEPSRIARGFVERVGDDVPLVVGGELCTAEELTALLITWVVEQVAGQQGGPAEHVVVTHSATWGAYRRGLLHTHLQRAGTIEVTLLPEPIAAGESYAVSDHLDVGGELAVYSLGAASFESSVVRRVGDGTFELRGAIAGTEMVGGAYFDDVLVDHLRSELGHELDELDSTDPQDRLAAAHLHEECTRAKERLSDAAEATIPVRLPRVRTDVRVARADFEELIRPTVDSTVTTLRRTVRSFATDHDQLAGVALIGGSSRIPLVAGMVSEGLRCRVAVERDPALTAARGAALAARRLLAGRGLGPALPAPARPTTMALRSDQPEEPDDEAEDFAVIHDVDMATPPPRPAIEMTPLVLPEPRSVTTIVPGLRRNILGGLVIVVILVGVVLTFVFEAGTSNRPAPFSTPSGGGSQTGMINMTPTGPSNAPTATLPGDTNH